eukprot:9498472-Pyramimonas_sp.AAC.1
MGAFGFSVGGGGGRRILIFHPLSLFPGLREGALAKADELARQIRPGASHAAMPRRSSRKVVRTGQR